MRRHKKKKGVLILLLTALVITLSISFDRINLQLYNTPLVFEQITTANDSLLGIWASDFGYYHDCNGCETKNTMLLTIHRDSSASIIRKIHSLKFLTFIPVIDHYYAVPEKEFLNELHEYELRNDCLIEFSDSTSYLYEFFEVFEYCGKYTSKIENPIYAHKIEWKESQLILSD
ncbi:MAG: hypothetical protein BalsKO_18090 [Balneolaceae bacterium]